MSKPRERWWSYVKTVIRAYPSDKKELDELRRNKLTPNYNPSGGHGGPGRTTEAAAMRELPTRRQKEMEAVERALARTTRRSNGDIRLRVIELVFFSGTHTLQGAALACHVSYGTAKNWNQAFIYTVAEELGLC